MLNGSAFPRRRWLAASLVTLLCALPPATPARPFWLQGAPGAADQEFLPPDVAFRVGAHLDGDQLLVRWVIADGYYLYRQKIEVTAESADLVLGPLQLPAGEALTDAWFGTQQIFKGQVTASLSVTRQDFGAHPVQVRVSYQGCATAGLCYPVIAKVLFPAEPDAARSPAAHPLRLWEGLAIGAGCLDFLLSGLSLRRTRERHHATP